MPDDVACDYCGTDTLAYEMHSDRGVVNRCIACLALEQGQPPGPEMLDNYDDDLREATLTSSRAYLTILCRVRQDDPILKRDEDDLRAIKDSVRESMLNLMGSEAYYAPSDIVDGDAKDLRDPAEATLGDYSDTDTEPEGSVDE